MIISRTPCRLSLAGGSTDYANAIEKFGCGVVVGGAIARYIYLSVRDLPPFHPYKTRLMYSKTECVNDNNTIEHAAIRACLVQTSHRDTGLEIVCQADIPGKSGVGSSSSFVVGLINALYAKRGRRVCPEELAEEAIHIEREVLKETVGLQDQTWAAFGGLNIIRFHRGGTFSVEPLPLTSRLASSLESHLLMVFTGQSRTSSEVASTYVGALTDSAKEHWSLVKHAEDAAEAICGEQFERLGKILDAGWRIKVNRNPAVAPKNLQVAYSAGILAGAWGGKLMGAGGGGCFLLVAPPEKHNKIVRAVLDAAQAERGVNIPVKFDYSGSTIIFAQRTT